MSSFIRNRWYIGALSQELAPGPQGIKPLGRKILGEDIAFYRTATGKVVALQSACPHRFAPLEYGDIIGENLKCRYHGLEFGPDGKCAKDPGNAKPPAMGVKSYPVAETKGFIFIWIGEEEPTEVPTYLNHPPEYGGALRNHLVIQANYKLLLDNLADDAHATHLHEFLNTEGHDARPKTNVEDNGETAVSVIDILDTSCIPMFRPFMKKPGNVDQRVVITWHEPTTFNTKSGVQELGGDLENTIGVESIHSITPETETSSHYFWMFERNVGLDNHLLTAKMDQQLAHIFKAEDAWIAEAQQKYIGDKDFFDLKPALLPQDKFSVVIRRKVEKIAKEQQIDVAVIDE
jgi:phenylpropionate dioxygenase-like ring-hydroxylating dioxygenase large terminal subunit